MRQPTSVQLLARIKIKQQTGRCILPFGVVSVAIVLWNLATPLLGRCQSPPAAIITVLVYNYVHVPHTTLVAAEREANRILEIAGARVDWIECQTDRPDLLVQKE